MMSRRQHKARFAENRGDDTVTGRPQQVSTATYVTLLCW